MSCVGSNAAANVGTEYSINPDPNVATNLGFDITQGSVKASLCLSHAIQFFIEADIHMQWL